MEWSRTEASSRETPPGAVALSVSVEIHHTGSDLGQRAEIAAHIEHALADQPGEWKVSIVGSQASDAWEMEVFGPNGFERAYMLEGTVGETAPHVIARIVAQMVSKSGWGP